MNELSGIPTLNKWVTFGDHFYRQQDEDPSIVFTSASGEKRTIVDYNGNIPGFPGFSDKDMDIILKNLKRRDDLFPVIRYRTDFEQHEDGKIIMIWQIQPDGMYWRDEDGYGMTPDEEIRLYSFIDNNGCFTAPFRLYNIGSKKFYEGI